MKWIKMYPEVNEPLYQTRGSAGMDIEAFLEEPVTLYPGGTAIVSTGLTVELDPNSELQIRPRSGLAFKYGVTVLNSPGTIDEDYTLEVKVLLVNHGKLPFTVNSGDRIAQAVYCPVWRAEQYIKDEDRDGGFGSTG